MENKFNLMAGVNKVILVGNAGKDPEYNVGTNNVKRARVSLATTESYKDASGNKKDITEWHDLVFFGGLADVVNSYVKKGHSLYIEGKIRTSEWENENGEYLYRVWLDQL